MIIKLTEEQKKEIKEELDKYEGDLRKLYIQISTVPDTVWLLRDMSGVEDEILWAEGAFLSESEARTYIDSVCWPDEKLGCIGTKEIPLKHGKDIEREAEADAMLEHSPNGGDFGV